jgi:hypothetical protein
MEKNLMLDGKNQNPLYVFLDIDKPHSFVRALENEDSLKHAKRPWILNFNFYKTTRIVCLFFFH